MSSGTSTGIWPEVCADLVDVLCIQHGRVNNHFERLRDLYHRCVNTSLPNKSRETDITARRAQIIAFHALVRDSIRHIQTGWPTTTKAEVRDALTGTNNSDADAHTNNVDLALTNKAIDTALCLWLSIDCVDEHHLGAILWPQTVTIEQFVLKRRFEIAIAVDHRDQVNYFPQDFRAAFLREISGIRIEQTYYLDQHLRFNEETRTVKIFMDIGWLKAMIRLSQSVIDTPDGSDSDGSPASTIGGHAASGDQQQPWGDGQVDGNGQSQVVAPDACGTAATALPSGKKQAATALLPIFEETLRTLDVLFPAWHSKTAEFLETFREGGSKVPWFTLQDLTNQEQQFLHTFKFWRFRLTLLIMEYLSPPRDLKRIWNDRRNPTAYWTFWIGMAIFLLTLVFGIVASVLAGLALRNKGE